MEKVKITQEQADALRKAIADYGSDNVMNDHVKMIDNWENILDPLNDLEPHQLARALYVGYEVEPEFKIGQWVKSRHGIGTGKITKIDKMGYYTDFGMIATSDDIRHATPQEIATEKARRWWAKHDRE